MNLKQQIILTGSLLSLALFVWAAPVHAGPDLIDVVEIVGTNPFIVHTNILPGDTFTDDMTVNNLTGTPQDIAMGLDIDLSEGIVPFPPFELEERITVRIEKVGIGYLILPGPGGDTVATLQELDDTVIDLGTIAGSSSQLYKISAVFDPNAGNEYQNTKVYFNISMSVDVPNIQGSLRIFKTNNAVGTQLPGDIVAYTLMVTALHGDVDGVTLTDLPPAGFVYVHGSGIGAPFIHGYASPGVWDLGDMAEGDTVTLTYKTKISSAQDDGLYRDLAFAKGISGGVPVLAADPFNPDPSVDPTNPTGDNFVGTQVAVATPTSEQVALNEDRETDTDTKIKRVLGAAILPATGANGLWIILAGLLAAIGGSLMYLGRRKKNQANSSVQTIMKVFILALLAPALVGFSGIAEAATPDPNISVRIEDPESPTDTGTFKIGFVTLDIEGRRLSAQCYETPGDIPVTTLYDDSISGGNSGSCAVDSFADGLYEFYVIASTGGDSTESAHVAVEIKSGTPGTPLNYDRDEHGCTVHFTTANDGLTSGVELYRSTELDFVADASTLAQEVAVGPNDSSSITDPGANCDDYYYAIRAVSAGGAGSGFVGDEKVTVRHRTRTVTQVSNSTATGAIPVGSGTEAGGVTTPTEGTVGGAETEQGTQPGQGEEGQVLGEEGVNGLASPEGLWDFIKRNRWPELGIIALLIIIYYAYRRKRNKQPQIR